MGLGVSLVIRCVGGRGVKKVIKGLWSQLLLASHHTIPHKVVSPNGFISTPPSPKEWVGAMWLPCVVSSWSLPVVQESYNSQRLHQWIFLWFRTVSICKCVWGGNVLSWAHDPLNSNPLSTFGRKDSEVSRGVWAHLKDSFQLHVHRPTLAWSSSLLRTFCHAFNNKVLEESVGKHYSGTLWVPFVLEVFYW